MRILVTGSNGLLGGFLVPELAVGGHEVLATGRGTCRLPGIPSAQVRYQSLDITDAQSVFEVLRLFRPDAVVHAAAMTQADDCELNPIDCWTVNVTATRFLIEACRSVGGRFLYVSTDFVFDGADGPYKEDALPSPVNYYGTSKLVAERAVLSDLGGMASVARTVLVYGRSPNIARSSLMDWVATRLRAGERIRVVTDQVRTPTYAGDLARGIRLLLERGCGGIWHLSGGDVLTPFEMANMTASHLGLDAGLMEPVTADTFTQPARRPPRTGFIIEKARRELGYEPISFREGLALSL